MARGRCEAGKENGQLMFKSPEHPEGSQGRVLKDSLSERVMGYVIGSCTVRRLVGAEVTG